MAKPKTFNDNFPIYVDGSCLTDSTDLHMSSKRNLSDQTVIQNEDLHEKSDQDKHTEALIHAAARAIVTSIEQDAYDRNAGSAISDLSYSGIDGTENSYSEGTELTFGDGTQLSYGDGTELSYDDGPEHEYEVDINDDPYDGSASSHHEEDDVFSHGRRSSGGSLNSSDEQHTDEEARYQLTKGEYNDRQEEETIAQIDSQEHEELSQEQEHTHDNISRIPSCASNAYSMLPEPLSLTSTTSPHTPSKVLNRPPFRTPSSVRAIQMSSPTPSIFSGSPTSRKRPTVSRLGTPSNINSSPTKSKTPTRFKAKKEYPLVLLHVTVLPLHWQHAQIIETAPTEALSKELLAVRESWKLLQEKLGDTVLERGVLLPHPQDSYETLEERLCAALELPMRPRARILDCGHYMGPSTTFSDTEPSSSESSDSEDLDSALGNSKRSLWCDVCCCDVRFGKYDALSRGQKKKSFKVKVYASNGLMGAGAWAACWREMERVDVEIEPLVDATLGKEIANLFEVAMAPRVPDEVVFEKELPHEEQHNPKPTEIELEMAAELAMEEELKHRGLEEELIKREREQERLREIYGEEAPLAPEPQPRSRQNKTSSTRTTRHRQDDSFFSLLLAAGKVLMQDKKNVLIFLLGLVVVFLAIRPGGSAADAFQKQELVMQQFQAPEIAPEVAVQIVRSVPQKVIMSNPPNAKIVEQVQAPVPPRVEYTEIVQEQEQEQEDIPIEEFVKEKAKEDALSATQDVVPVEAMEVVEMVAEVEPADEPSDEPLLRPATKTEIEAEKPAVEVETVEVPVVALESQIAVSDVPTEAEVLEKAR